MQRGLYISGGAHALVIGWLLFGGLFHSAPPEMQVANVTVLSEQQFAALTQSDRVPDTPDPAPQQPSPPPDPEPAPVRPTPRPDPQPAPQPDTPPVPQPEQPEPLPQIPQPPAPAEAQDTPPVLIPPDPEPDVPIGPEPAPLPGTTAPVRSVRPKPRPAPRVAPAPVAPPDPDSVVAEETQRAVSPDASSPDKAEDPKEATAPEEATSEIITEAETPSGAPTASLRPQARPPRAAAAPAVATEAEPAVPSADDALNAALAEALAGGGADAAPSGPPMTRGETEGLKLAVEACWIVDVGSQAANVTVTVGFELDRDGRILAGTMQMLSSQGGTGGTGGAVEAAFQSARRAILRCQASGYDLPAQKYDHWKKVEMTFDPSQMRLR